MHRRRRLALLHERLVLVQLPRAILLRVAADPRNCFTPLG